MRTSYLIRQQNSGLRVRTKYELWPSGLTILAFLIPASSFIEIEVIGRLFGSDILCLGLFPLLLYSKRGILKSPFARTFIWLGLFYFCGQVITDLVLQTPYYDYWRGWAKIAVTILSFCTILMVIGFERAKILIFAVGIAAGDILQFFFNPGIFTEGDLWKFGIGGAVTWLIIISTSYFQKMSIVKTNSKLLILFLAGALNLYFGYRSLAGICFLTLAYLILQRLLQTLTNNGADASTKKVILMGIGLFAAAVMIIEGYEFSAREGWLGLGQQHKYEAQAYGEFGLFLGGRSEILVAVRAIRESPFLGHGSWAKDWEYANMLVALKRQLGYSPGTVDELGLIPTHSHFFGAWVEAGLLGAIFWGWILSLPVRAGRRLIIANDPHTILLVFIAFILAWDILFSPFGATRRFLMPFYAVCMIDILLRYPGRPRKT